MTDLISRPRLLSRSVPCPPSYNHADPTESASYNFILGFETARAQIQKVIEAEPTVDAIPVTRCKDCMHCQLLNDNTSFECRHWEMDFYAPTYNADTYYCADAEIKG